MGMDYVALLKYPGPGERLSRALDYLEAESPPAVRAAFQVFLSSGMVRPATRGWEYKRRGDLRNPQVNCRPTLPSHEFWLGLPEEFYLTFGPDTVQVYPVLRWYVFLTDPAIQTALLDATVALAGLLGATEAVVTSDHHPAVVASDEGVPFEEALLAGGLRDGERPSLADLSEDTAESWDSHGYWRLPLPPLGADRIPSRPPAPALRNPVPDGWQTGGDLDAMLDFVLKREPPDRRKVRLWACACVRRLWGQLKSPPVREGVEALERYADGQIDAVRLQQAAAAVRKVRKGDRRANAVVGELLLLGEPPWGSPPGDLSRRVSAAVGEGDAAAFQAEQAAHADLLRDIFGLDPLGQAVDLTWLTPTVLALARATYEERLLPSGHLDPVRLAILGDALLDAGCADSVILDHLRGPGTHVRGCWAVDLLLDAAGHSVTDAP